MKQNRRRQFGVYGDIEYPVIDYTYIRLVPFIASSFAISSFCNYVKEMQAEKKYSLEKLFILTISFKIASTWEALKALQVCRECCGAEGYLEKNIIPSLKGDVDGMITMDGDNTALLQLIGRYLIHKLHERFKKRGAQMAYMKERMKYMLFENQFIRARADPSVMLTPEFQLRAFKMREERLLISLAGRFNNKLHKSVNSFDAWNKVRDHVSSLTNAFIQRMILKSFSNDISNSTASDSTKFYLNQMRSLYALNIIANDPWFYTTGNFTLSHLKIIRFQVCLFIVY
jgi:acyl-CoA oxidase